jgi:peroxiredoxin
METNQEANDSRWVEERLSTLNADAEWNPSASDGLARLREGCERHRRRHRKWGVALMLVAASSISVAAFPVTRAFAGRCITACVEETSRLFGPAHTAAKLEVGATAPDFTLTDASGQMVRLSDLRGKPVLLNFWATWCPPCRIEIPWFMEFQRTYGAQGLVVLGVSFDEDGWQSVKPFVESQRVNYRMVVGNDELARMYGGLDALPTTLLIDPQGKIVSIHAGLAGKDTYASEIQALLAGHPTAR